MAKWLTSSVTYPDYGHSENDGTGDSIRNAFIAVDTNFQNLSSYLAQDTIDFTNTIVSNNAVFSNVSISNVIAINGTVLGNITINNALTSNLNVANSAVFNTVSITGQTDIYGTVIVHNNIVPSANLQYNLGSPSNFFGNIYAKNLVQVNTVSASSDAGLLTLHANLLPGDTKDVGVFGKYNETIGGNSFAFFGYQHTTNNFVYKITKTDVTLGNSVVSDGFYGNVQFGSAFLSNATVGGNTLIVAGNTQVTGTAYGNINGQVANIGMMTITGNVNGNVSFNGNLFSLGYPVVTTNMLGTYGNLYTGGIITGDAYFLSTTPTTGIGTGAVKINGGLSVAGNIQTAGLVGPLYGVVQTAAQPNITSLGVLPTLTANSIQATSLGLNSLTAAGGTVSFQTFTASGNVTVANILATQFNGQLQGLVALPAQPLITSVGTLTALSVAGNISAPTLNGNLNSNSAVIGSVYSDDYNFANGSPYVTTLANTADIVANVSSGYNIGSSLTPTGVVAGTYGNGVIIPRVTSDSKGRILSLSNVAISPITMVGTNGNSAVTGVGNVLTFTTINGMVIRVLDNNISISAPQSVEPGASPTFQSINANANITSQNLTACVAISTATGYITNVVASTVSASNIGNVNTTLRGTLSSLSNAQPNITSTGTLTGLNVSGSTNLSGPITLGGNLSITAPATYISNNLYVSGSLYVRGNSIIVDSTSVITNDLQYVAAANAGSIDAADGAGLVTPYGAVLLSAANNAWTSNIGFRATSLFDNGNRVVSTTIGTGNLTITGSNIALTTIGPGTTTAGSATSIPTVSIDPYGRVTGLTATTIQNISTTASVQHASLGINTTPGATGEIRASGEVTAYYSDDRLKTRLGNIENALDKIDLLTGFYYEENELAESLGYKKHRQVGVSAQDTQRQMPEIVTTAPISDDYLTVKYEKFAPLLIEGIKELRQELRAIKRHLGLE
jgi:hypothetical protein